MSTMHLCLARQTVQASSSPSACSPSESQTPSQTNMSIDMNTVSDQHKSFCPPGVFYACSQAPWREMTHNDKSLCFTAPISVGEKYISYTVFRVFRVFAKEPRRRLPTSCMKPQALTKRVVQTWWNRSEIAQCVLQILALAAPLLLQLECNGWTAEGWSVMHSCAFTWKLKTLVSFKHASIQIIICYPESNKTPVVSHFHFASAV